MNKKSKRGGLLEREHSTWGVEKSAVQVAFDTFSGWFFGPKNAFFPIFGDFFVFFLYIPLSTDRRVRARRARRAFLKNSTTSFPFLQSTFEHPQKTHICPPSQWQTDRQDIKKIQSTPIPILRFQKWVTFPKQKNPPGWGDIPSKEKLPKSKDFKNIKKKLPKELQEKKRSQKATKKRSKKIK